MGPEAEFLLGNRALSSVGEQQNVDIAVGSRLVCSFVSLTLLSFFYFVVSRHFCPASSVPQQRRGTAPSRQLQHLVRTMAP